MVDQVRASALLLSVEHRHGDEWVRLEPSSAHDVAQSDPERLQAVQFLATRLTAAGHTTELVTTSTH